MIKYYTDYPFKELGDDIIGHMREVNPIYYDDNKYVDVEVLSIKPPDRFVASIKSGYLYTDYEGKEPITKEGLRQYKESK